MTKYTIINKQYELFRKEYLPKFRKSYQDGNLETRTKLKRNLYSLKKLTERQKDELWKQITKK